LLLLAKLKGIKFGTTFIFGSHLENTFLFLKMGKLGLLIEKIKKKQFFFLYGLPASHPAHQAMPAVDSR
jgi:hypothetical protein